MGLEKFDILKFRSKCANCGLLPIGYIFAHGLNNECITLRENMRDKSYFPSDNLEYLEWKYNESRT